MRVQPLCVHQRCVHQARRDCIDPDPVGTVHRGHGASETEQCTLAGRVRDGRVTTAQPCDRGHVDDRSTAGHCRNQVSGQQKHRIDVDTQARSPGIQVDIHHASSGTRDTHVVDQDVHPAMLLEHVRGKAAAGRVVSDVCDDRRDLHTERGTHLNGAFEIRPAVVDQNDMRPGPGESDGAGAADPDPRPTRSGAADDCNFACQAVVEPVRIRFAVHCRSSRIHGHPSSVPFRSNCVAGDRPHLSFSEPCSCRACPYISESEPVGPAWRPG